jgi:hypothetical protein
MDDAREEMRKLIDVIEKGAKSASVEQAVDDINSSQIQPASSPTRWIRGLRPKTPSQRVSQNPQRLWGNQNHRCPPFQNLQTRQRHKTLLLACPQRSAQRSHRQIMIGSSRRVRRHHWAAVKSNTRNELRRKLQPKLDSFRRL